MTTGIRYGRVLVVATFVASCSSDGGGSECLVTRDLDGTVRLQCSGDEEIAFPSCFSALPDLDGNGVTDVSDCELVGVGQAMRAICSSEREPRADPSCRSVKTSTVATNTTLTEANAARVGAGQPADANKVAFAYVVTSTNGALHLWVDANDDGVWAA